MSQEKNYEIFVDHVKYAWPHETISGKQLRELANIPESAEIFLQVPGSPDKDITDNTVVDVAKHKGPPRFSTQSTGSQAG